MLTFDKINAFIDALVKLRDNADDKTASLTGAAYPTLKGKGKLIATGTRINHNGKLLRAAVDLWDTPENSPENAPDLWEEIEYRAGIRVIPETITVGKAFALNELGLWEDKVYKSLINANVYTPAAYPAGWEEVTDV